MGTHLPRESISDLLRGECDGRPLPEPRVEREGTAVVMASACHRRSLNVVQVHRQREPAPSAPRGCASPSVCVPSLFDRGPEWRASAAGGVSAPSMAAESTAVVISFAGGWWPSGPRNNAGCTEWDPGRHFINGSKWPDMWVRS